MEAFLQAFITIKKSLGVKIVRRKFSKSPKGKFTDSMPSWIKLYRYGGNPCQSMVAPAHLDSMATSNKLGSFSSPSSSVSLSLIKFPRVSIVRIVSRFSFKTLLLSVLLK